MSSRSSLEKEETTQIEESITATASEKSPTTSLTSTEPSLLDIDDELSTSSKPVILEPNTEAPIQQAQEEDEFDEQEPETKQDGFNEFHDEKEAPKQEQEDNAFDDFDTPPAHQQQDEDDFDGFGEFDNEFVDANNGGDDDDFGEFDDFEAAPPPAPFDEEEQEPEEPEEVLPKTPTEAELYVDVLENRPEEMNQFIENYLNKMWSSGHTEQEEQVVSSPIEQNEFTTDILNTPCSRDLWSKLSRDTVFYNPVTGAVGQFQWTRSETNKAYLNALGVTFNHAEEKSPSSVHSPSSPNHVNTKRRQSNIMDGKRITTSSNNGSSTSLPSSPDGSPSTTHLRSASATGGLRVVTTSNKLDESAKEAKKEADQEMELDIDIARAYCELTEETIRIFPDVKLNAMVIELSRLQRQAADYLDNLLDQREQLKMDAETYNDLISCIVGHAQRLHVQSKDASPAMVSKTKKSKSGSGFSLRRKNTTNPANTTGVQSASMGGGVVGVKKGPAPKRTQSSASQIPATMESRRSM